MFIIVQPNKSTMKKSDLNLIIKLLLFTGCIACMFAAAFIGSFPVFVAHAAGAAACFIINPVKS